MIEMTVEEFFKRIDKQQDEADEARAMFARTMDELDFHKVEEAKPVIVKAKKDHKTIAKDLVESFRDYYFTGSDVLDIAEDSSHKAKRFDDIYKEQLIINLKELGYEMLSVRNPELRSRKAYRLKKVEQ